ncbi:hypothetical protein CISG_04369 [Coccidioides immitis RMSCC 3703]|uniref:Uncharacterized protein n=2 Tax=Coccidioides immitis TaxID=5501 RepID=A0A0J8QV05_COCIT|nr:hypothetical protein CIRG_09005 [Coccidioides immitis RMSCC 2394]KMU75083.1 hypothetical protein CISG_04369 [Coccidioides immitis RMSCC 3703]
MDGWSSSGAGPTARCEGWARNDDFEAAPATRQRRIVINRSSNGGGKGQDRIFVSTRLHLPILICSLTNAIPMDGSEYRAISITWDCCPICAQEQRRLGLTPKRFTCRTAFPWNLEDRLYQYSPADFIDV